MVEGILPQGSEDLLADIRNENLNVYRASHQRLREDAGQEGQIAKDYRGQLIYEILQNADDALSESGDQEARMRFLLLPDALWVANSGRPLSEADVRGLCGIGASSKTAASGRRRASIGHKGMGFKSVLEISDAPEVYSSTWSFRFGRQSAMDAVQVLVDEQRLDRVEWAPITRFPWPVSTTPAEWEALRGLGMRTAFRLGVTPKVEAAG